MTVRYQRSDQDFYYNQDSSLNSSQTSVGIDDYLDEALIDDYGITQNDDSHDDLDSHLSRGKTRPQRVALLLAIRRSWTAKTYSTSSGRKYYLRQSRGSSKKSAKRAGPKRIIFSN
ncbi:uncharacterized protein LOC108158324 isoform X2 [Drosophila miranda]|uniref:uncharacterized protein LOC108158324 isoform X2 n=1 Tax=Drosophila miranda TaxID=7229 RepID=UPI00143F9177|nr:uncharacterized protein LOC108158324 isoform X2 [Drosophila miranda]